MSRAAEGLKLFMRHYPQGVTVVTTSHGGRLWGLTVSSFASISLDPPLVMFAISRTAPSHDAFVRSNSFVVNLLADDQERVSEIFAGRVETLDKFSNVEYFMASNGSPVISGSVAFLECRLWRTYDGGDHTLILGEVLGCEVMRKVRPLLYYCRSYAAVAHKDLDPSCA